MEERAVVVAGEGARRSWRWRVLSQEAEARSVSERRARDEAGAAWGGKTVAGERTLGVTSAAWTVPARVAAKAWVAERVEQRIGAARARREVRAPWEVEWRVRAPDQEERRMAA